MSGHTPGPWIIKGTLFGEWHISSEYGVDGNKLVNGRQHVACSPSASSKLNPDYFSMFMANARLIAAAPELLEALAGMLEIYGVRAQHMEREPFASSTEVECCNQARAAIAKAKGEA